jgi:hypothetical protein
VKNIRMGYVFVAIAAALGLGSYAMARRVVAGTLPSGVGKVPDYLLRPDEVPAPSFWEPRAMTRDTAGYLADVSKLYYVPSGAPIVLDARDARARMTSSAAPMPDAMPLAGYAQP